MRNKGRWLREKKNRGFCAVDLGSILAESHTFLFILLSITISLAWWHGFCFFSSFLCYIFSFHPVPLHISLCFECKVKLMSLNHSQQLNLSTFSRVLCGLKKHINTLSAISVFRYFFLRWLEAEYLGNVVCWTNEIWISNIDGMKTGTETPKRFGD